MFHSTYFSRFGKRTAMFGVAALAVSLGACGDSATAPGPRGREVAGPNNVMVGMGGGNVVTWATANVVDKFGFRISDPLLKVKFTSMPSGQSVVVQDNDSTDYNSTKGLIKAALKPGTSYEVCFESAYFYANDNSQPGFYPKCRTVWSSISNVSFPDIYGRRYPRLVFYSKDAFGNLIIPGGTLQITLAGWTGIIKDGNDLNFGGDEDGIIRFETRHSPTTISWCEYKAPWKYELVSDKCGTIDTKWDSIDVVNWVHEKLVF